MKTNTNLARKRLRRLSKALNRVRNRRTSVNTRRAVGKWAVSHRMRPDVVLRG
jgi:hypothetical protein